MKSMTVNRCNSDGSDSRRVIVNPLNILYMEKCVSGFDVRFIRFSGVSDGLYVLDSLSGLQHEIDAAMSD